MLLVRPPPLGPGPAKRPVPPMVRVRFNPSSFTTNGRTWRIGPGRFVFDSTRIDVDRFSISSGQQRRPSTAWPRVAIGIRCACSCTGSTLKPFSRFAERQGYAFEGVTNGSAELISAMEAECSAPASISTACASTEFR